MQGVSAASWQGALLGAGTLPCVSKSAPNAWSEDWPNGPFKMPAEGSDLTEAEVVQRASVARALSEARGRHRGRWTVAAIAKATGLDEALVSRTWSGGAPPANFTHMALVAQALGVRLTTTAPPERRPPG